MTNEPPSMAGLAGSGFASGGGGDSPLAAGGLGGGAAAGGGAGGASGAGGDVATNVPFIDRCKEPGPPPAAGNADGSDYHFGEVLEIGKTAWSSLLVADVDRNGRPDIIGLDWFTPAMTYLQLEPGKFSDGSKAQDVRFDGFAPSTGIASLDIDGDGALDLVVTRGNNRGLTVLSNDGSGVFASSYALGTRSLNSPVAWDVDADGDLDVVAVATDTMYISTNSQLALYINDGTKLSLERLVPLPTRAYGLQIVNVSGDARPELLLQSEGLAGHVIVFEQQDFASVTQSQDIFASGDSDSTLWWQAGDLDGDGKNDLVLVEDQNTPDTEHVWISHNENGTLGAAQPIATLPKDGGNIAGGPPRIADINLDGHNDIVISSDAFDMIALLGQADRSYRMIRKAYPNFGSIENGIAVGDINCDGCPDVLGDQIDTIRAFTGVGCARR
jgi:hypothetical protein